MEEMQLWKPFRMPQDIRGACKARQEPKSSWSSLMVYHTTLADPMHDRQRLLEVVAMTAAREIINFGVLISSKASDDAKLESVFIAQGSQNHALFAENVKQRCSLRMPI